MRHRRHEPYSTAGTEGFANPFCVLGLSADAQGIAIQQAAQRALMQRRLAEKGDTTDSQVRAIENAHEQLKDPVARFRAGLRWVTLNHDEVAAWGGTPEARTLAFDNTMLVGDGYETIATADSVAVRNHNIAVLLCADAHRLASLGDLEAAADTWRRGFERWSLCLASEEFLQRQRERARSLDDARLNASFVSDELAGIPRRLLSEPAALASAALESRRVRDAVALVDLIRSAPFDGDFIDGVLQTVYRPLARRVESEIDRLDARRADIVSTHDGSGSAATAKAARELQDLLRLFKEHVAPDLEEMLQLGDLPGLAEEHARDHASRFLEQLGLNAWNLADDADLAQETTRLANRFADAKSLKDKLANSLSQLSDQTVLRGELEEIMTLAAGPRAPEAIERLKALKGKVSSRESHKLLDSLVERVSNHHAVSVFTEAMELVQRRGEPSAIRRKLEEARRYATDPEARATLDQYLQQIRTVESRVAAQQGTGCLIPLVVGFGTLGAILTSRFFQ